MRFADPELLMIVANDDAEFRRAARDWTATMAFESPSDALRVEIADGRIVGCRDGRRGERATITIVADDDGWREFLAPTPRPFYQDLVGGCVQHHGFTIVGDTLTLTAYYHAVQRLVAIMRSGRAGEGRRAAV